MQRHIRTVDFEKNEPFPTEDCAFTAQQALKKLFKCWIDHANEEEAQSHEFSELASFAMGAQPNCFRNYNHSTLRLAAGMESFHNRKNSPPSCKDLKADKSFEQKLVFRVQHANQHLLSQWI